MITPKDRLLLRELAKQYAEIAAQPINAERRKRGQDNNSLRPARPLVWVEEIPWHEMDIDGQLLLHCESEMAREMERHFRRTLYRWRYIQSDMVVEDAYYVEKYCHVTGLGVEVREDTRAVDDDNNIISHCYEDVLETPEQVDALRLPVVTADPALDEAKLAEAREVLDGILPVKPRGHGLYHAPWDVITRLRGVEPILIDMMDRPEHLHAIRKKFMEAGLSQYEQMERLGLLGYDVSQLHCTPPYADELPAPDYDGGGVRLKDIWFRGMAQMFSTVSPAMHKEFDLDYMRPVMDKCGLSYYGCCEPLDNKLDLLFEIPNIRKLGVSPWASVEYCAERMGGNYVFARKPNPAFVAGSFDAETVRRETVETVEACLKYGCPYELVLKDISTVSYKPQNLIDWVNTVQETVDGYY